MTDINIAIALVSGTVNPLLVQFIINGVETLFGFKFSSLDENKVKFYKSLIMAIVLLSTGSLVLWLMYDAEIVKTTSEIITTFITYTFASQGSYDLLYSKVFKKA